MKSSRLDSGLWNPGRLLTYKRHFYAMTTGVDFAIGQLLGKLEDLGELDDTLIIFMSDHGDACGDHFNLEKYYDLFYDGVVRVPLVFHWPNGIGRHGRRVEGVVELVDVLPTILDACGAAVPEVLMGHSLAGALRGEGVPAGRRDALTFSCDADGPHMLLTTPKYKYSISRGRETLWDVRGDGGETRNVAADHPEAVAEFRWRLLNRLAEAGRSYRTHHHLF